MLNKTSILLSDIYKMSDSEFNILLELYSNNATTLSTDEIKSKYSLNITYDYDNTPVGMEACWVEHSGTLIYFVNDDNFICSKNEHEINSCYIGYIAEMISDFKLYTERNSNIVNKILAKKNIVKFYTNYFFILNKSANYKNATLENSSKKFAFLLDEVSHYSLPNKVQLLKGV